MCSGFRILGNLNDLDFRGMCRFWGVFGGRGLEGRIGV